MDYQEMLKRYKDPKVIGPGVWFYFLLSAKRAYDEQGKRDFLRDVYLIAEEFPCHRCRDHFNEFIDSFPPESYLDYESGALCWVIDAHNNANRICNKTEHPREEVFRFLTDLEEGCSKECGVEEINETYERIYLPLPQKRR